MNAFHNKTSARLCQEKNGSSIPSTEIDNYANRGKKNHISSWEPNGTHQVTVHIYIPQTSCNIPSARLCQEIYFGMHRPPMQPEQVSIQWA